MNQFKHANWWRSYLGELSKDFGWLQAWLSSGNTSTSNGEEENRVKKTAAVFFRTLEALPEVHFFMLYTIWKLRKSRIQRFKPCMIWSWNEEVTAFWRWLLQAEGRILHGCEISLLLREFRSHFEQCTSVLLKLPDSCDRHFWIFCFRFLMSKSHFLLVTYQF